MISGQILNSWETLVANRNIPDISQEEKDRNEKIYQGLDR